ncbi:alkaline phosphatase [Fulvivirga sp. RKSG066]|uniref:alkaline phosphatase D family protein n=1 Tax=Fulvivirga aurantia TaxID=2529383 RepID=UPI0012BD0AC4|nr:alkaline phosphatase D family protein [Fulvivirga aurantia]MTI23232.1 alkaline phosphatase [Fulvivirga aurantia]
MYRLLPLVFIISLFACKQQEKEITAQLPTGGIANYYDSAKWPFYHGVASGDPLSDAVIIWTRVTPKDSLDEVTVKWQISTDSAFASDTKEGDITTSSGEDYTVKVDVKGLQSGTKYFYRFNALDKVSPIGKTRTTPTGNVSELNFAVASCANYEFGKFNAYRAIADEADLNAVLHLGDYIYEYGPGSYGDSTTGRFHYPAKEIITLEDYRLRYSQYRLDADLAAAHQNHPFIVIWDDHEIANNSYVDGAQNHQDDEGDYAKRKAAARKAYYEWMPVRESDKLYRSFAYGDLADLIMLDERLAGRTAPPENVDDPNILEGKMLGDAQLNWFNSELKNSDARWKVIGNQVIFSYLNWGRPTFSINLDSWDGYPTERAAIKSNIIENDLKNVIFVTGDTHSSWAFEVTDELNPDYKPFAVEFGTTSINSGNSNERFATDSVIVHEKKIMNSPLNPHLKYANLRDHGFLQLTLMEGEALATWKYVNLKGEPGIIDQKQIRVDADGVRLKLD